MPKVGGKSGKTEKKRRNREEKAKIGKVSLCPSWQIGLAARPRLGLNEIDPTKGSIFWPRSFKCVGICFVWVYFKWYLYDGSTFNPAAQRHIPTKIKLYGRPYPWVLAFYHWTYPTLEFLTKDPFFVVTERSPFMWFVPERPYYGNTWDAQYMSLS